MTDFDEVKYHLEGVVIGGLVYVNSAQVVGLLMTSADVVREAYPEAANALSSIATVINGIGREAEDQAAKQDEQREQEE